ncbi:GntR family transcriptional regulator [Rhodococcus fascians]|nr:GntR family transcriptional regulator [Rhodococcus fascians]MBY4237863.1 GntR family transcriptional regulator [Rhodococcus fascians]MBY4253386.1 GntR family transcriptional regulator [Rhodococcus fascians]MBY4269023.1 GntR family transcriptional regulator [Rhodococcus fascians]MBY4275076.1 GntR family transcriptional regulator [Rhodococcus fascians]
MKRNTQPRKYRGRSAPRIDTAVVITDARIHHVDATRKADSTLLTDQVYSMIHSSIMNGELPAGSRLRIRDLAAQVGTSVMPVREAIRRLEEAGLAEHVPHKGAVVRGLTFAELVQVYDVRLLLEVEAARLGAQRISAADAKLMEAEFDAMRAAILDGRVVALLDHDEELLSILYRASGNPVLVDTIRGLWQHCRAYKIVGATGAVDTGDVQSLWIYQQRLVEAAIRGDAATAAGVSHDSLVNATNRIRRLLEDQQNEATAG